MSWRKELREIRRERDDRIRLDVLLRTDLEGQLDIVLMYVQIADQLFSLVGRLVRRRRARRTRRR